MPWPLQIYTETLTSPPLQMRVSHRLPPLPPSTPAVQVFVHLLDPDVISLHTLMHLERRGLVDLFHVRLSNHMRVAETVKRPE